MAKISLLDNERLTHINYLMDGVHDSCDSIYECLVDREFKELSSVITDLISTLNDIDTSVNDD
jgi:hypothetical protein